MLQHFAFFLKRDIMGHGIRFYVGGQTSLTKTVIIWERQILFDMKYITLKLNEKHSIYYIINYVRSFSVNVPNSFLRLSLAEMKRFATSISDSLSSTSLCSFKKDKELYLFWPIVDRSHVLILLCNEKERSGVADVAPLVRTIRTIVHTFLINERFSLSISWNMEQISWKDSWE